MTGDNFAIFIDLSSRLPDTSTLNLCRAQCCLVKPNPNLDCQYPLKTYRNPGRIINAPNLQPRSQSPKPYTQLPSSPPLPSPPLPSPPLPPPPPPRCQHPSLHQCPLVVNTLVFISAFIQASGSRSSPTRGQNTVHFFTTSFWGLGSWVQA